MKNRGFLSRSGVDLLSVKSDVVTPLTPDLSPRRSANAGSSPQLNDTNAPDPSQTGATEPLAPKPKKRDDQASSYKKTLHLRISSVSAALIADLLSQADEQARILTKRQIVSSFRKHLLESEHCTDKSFTGVEPYRIDVRLPPDLVDRISELEKLNPFEPLATVLGRALSHRFDAFIRSSLAK